jgi:hypothetical protein
MAKPFTLDTPRAEHPGRSSAAAVMRAFVMMTSEAMPEA